MSSEIRDGIGFQLSFRPLWLTSSSTVSPGRTFLIAVAQLWRFAVVVVAPHVEVGLQRVGGARSLADPVGHRVPDVCTAGPD